MATNSPKMLRIRPWEVPSPLTSKRQRLDNSMQDTLVPITDATAFSGCLRMPTPDGFDEMEHHFSHKLSPELEPHLYDFQGSAGPVSPPRVVNPTGGISQTGFVSTERQPTPMSFEGSSTTANRAPTSAPPLFAPQPLDAYSSAGMQASLALLEADSHAARLVRANNEQNDKSTGKTYQRHVDRFERWWTTYQADQTIKTPGRTSIPAFPITAAKVSMFLEYECNREKVVSSALLLSIILLIDGYISTEKDRQSD